MNPKPLSVNFFIVPSAISAFSKIFAWMNANQLTLPGSRLPQRIAGAGWLAELQSEDDVREDRREGRPGLHGRGYSTICARADRRSWRRNSQRTLFALGWENPTNP